ncbi:hypothetical protein JVU11DRAFT_1587 [Chiua virens]|nr:hypothetical protein JVU11DRAFT_1587 [Chiua virens]
MPSSPPERENKSSFARVPVLVLVLVPPTLTPLHYPLPPLPHPRHPHKDVIPDNNPPSSYAKSSLRSQNRPVSSTTTATHSTITPLPSDALRNRLNAARHAYTFQPQSIYTHTSLRDHDQYADTCEYDSDNHHFLRSETPSSTKRKLFFPSFFGISLTRRSSSSTMPHQSSSSISERKASTSTSVSEPKSKSSRRRSFRLTSRPSTPKSVNDSSTSKSPYSIPVPSNPLPLSASPRQRSFGLGNSQRSTPKSSSYPLASPTRSTRCSSGRAFHRNLHKASHPPDGGGRNKGKDREKPLADSDGTLPNFRPDVDFSSQSLPVDPSPISRNHLSPHSPGLPMLSYLPTVDSASSEENDFLVSHHLLGIPKIIHTPPTPQRPGGEVERSGFNPPEADHAKVESTKDKSVIIGHREQVLVSNSQSHADVHRATPSKGRFTPRIFGGKDLPKIKDNNARKSGRRPDAGSSGGPSHKIPGSSIASAARNMSSHRSKLGSFDFERPVSALNRSTSTVDQQGSLVSKDTSSYSKTHLPSLERTISEDSARGGKSRLNAHHTGQAESPMLSQLKPEHTGDTSVVSFSTVSVQTMSTGKGVGSNIPVGQSSSWGRAAGKRILRTSHGTFAFEHPSSMPSSPNPQSFNLPSGSKQADLSLDTSNLPQSQPTTPLHTVFDTRVKHSRGQSYNSSDHATPGFSKPGERKSKGKGRSLDLGLGLSWAPSRLREEVLMPGSILTREKSKLEKSTTNGPDVSKVFEGILSESRFQIFKKYVRRFDAHIIPLEGPSGLLARVEKLLAESGLGERERNKLMSEFAVFVKNHNG